MEKYGRSAINTAAGLRVRVAFFCFGLSEIYTVDFREKENK